MRFSLSRGAETLNAADSKRAVLAMAVAVGTGAPSPPAIPFLQIDGYDGCLPGIEPEIAWDRA
jgi:hypothetical protein